MASVYPLYPLCGEMATASLALALLTVGLVPGLAGGCVLVTGGQPHPLSVEMVCPDLGMSIHDFIIDMTRHLV